MDGRVLDKGSLLFKGDRIVALGTNVDIPLLARRIDADGATVTPGLIDAHSSLGRTRSGAGSASAKRRAEDAFDRYATRDLVEALRNGVTAVYLSPGNSPGVCGTGAVLRLSPDRTRESFGQVLKSQAALCIDLASASKPITRLKTLQGVEKAFRDALEYRKSLEDYDEKLDEYSKKLKEQAEKNEADEAKQEAKSKKAKPSAAEDEKEDDKPEGKDDADEGEKKDEDKPKKPQRPSRNPTAEIVLLAIDRRIPVRVSAYRSADILNALNLAEEFSLDMILEDVTEAHLVAAAIAKAEIHVVLGRMDYDVSGQDTLYRRAVREPGTALGTAGVSWIAGSGDDVWVRSRFVTMNAQLAGGSSPSTNPLRIVTAAAANTLRVGDQIGRLRPGLLADFVLWSGDPLDPESQVRQVYVGGTLAFDRADASEEGAGQ
jgi:imidazolonepropionase-like amidohydrolase